MVPRERDHEHSLTKQAAALAEQNVNYCTHIRICMTEMTSATTVPILTAYLNKPKLSKSNDTGGLVVRHQKH